ncbi:hypothetical protein RI054_17g78160 [Pseudoscourfieldia marina]
MASSMTAISYITSLPHPAYDRAVDELRMLCGDAPYVRPATKVTLQPGAQPLKDARIVKEETSYAEHVRQSERMVFPASLGDELTEIERECIVRASAVNMKGTLMAERRRRGEIVAEVAKALQPLDDYIWSFSPPRSSFGVVENKPNVALVCALADAIDWPDKRIGLALVTGMAIVGAIPDTGLFRRIVPMPVPFVANHLRDSLLEEDGYILRLKASVEWRAARHRHDRAQLIAVEERSNAEADKGHLGPCLSYAQLIRNYGHRLRPMRRFGVLQNGKIRCCDDGKESLTNAATSLEETVTLPSPTWYAAAAEAALNEADRHGVERPRLVSALDDMEAAYRQVPTDDPRFTFIAYFSVRRNAVVFRAVRGHNFGLKSAVSNFSRVPHLMAAASCKLLLYLTTHYIDDFMSMDFESQGDSGQRMFARLASLTGYRLDPKKRQMAASANSALGIRVDLAQADAEHAVVTLSPIEDRIAKVLQTMRQIRSQGKIEPAEADSLLGRLQYLSSSMFSKPSLPSTTPPIVKPKSVAVPRAGRPVNVRIYTDASLSGFGVVIAIGKVLFWASHDVTADIIEKFAIRLGRDEEALIADLEGLASLCGLLIFDRLLQSGRVSDTLGATEIGDLNVVHFIDNMHVLSNLISGYSRQESLVVMMLDYYLAVARMEIRSYHEYVASKANISDIPSRDTSAHEFAEAALYRENCLDFVFPHPSSLRTASPLFPRLCRGIRGRRLLVPTGSPTAKDVETGPDTALSPP